MINSGMGPSAGTNATALTPSKENIDTILKVAQKHPMNLGFLGKGNASNESRLEEQVKTGALGFKIHEDWGSTPAVINHALNVADKYDMQSRYTHRYAK